MNTKEVYGSLDEQVYEINISRADKMNALTDKMYGSLVEQLKFAEESDEIKVILLKSDNKHFSAGNDLADFLETEFNNDSNVIQFLMTLVQLSKPLVCAVGGAAVGIGTTMLLHCDFVYASAGTKFSVPFIKLGLTPEGGSSKLLARRIGMIKANDWLMTGRTILADEAFNSGLVTGVYEDIESTWKETKATAVKLARSPASVLTQTKELLNNDRQEIIDTIKQEAKIFAACLETEEAKAAFNAFLKK